MKYTNILDEQNVDKEKFLNGTKLIIKMRISIKLMHNLFQDCLLLNIPLIFIQNFF